MSLDYQAPRASKGLIWTGRVLSALPALGMLASAGMKLSQKEPVLRSFEHLGFSPKLALMIGIIELSCVVIYVIPQTAVIGAILMTSYLGGAVVTHLRVGETAWVFPVLLGVLAWLGLLLRDARLRPLLPIRSLNG